MSEKPEKWHSIGKEQVLEKLDTGRDGLSSRDAARRLEKGRNVIKGKEGRSAWALLAGQFRSSVVAILLFAAVVSALLGEIIDAAVIAVILVINALLGFYQERKAERALEALKKMASPKSRVLRDGHVISVDSEELVPGDVLVLEAGDRVPADARLIDVKDTKVDESLLTGESTPVSKDAGKVGDVAVADRRNMLFLGTTVVAGKCRAVVAETGMSTEFGKIAEELREPEETTPLQKKLGILGRHLALLVVLVSAVVFFAGMLRGIEIVEIFLVAVTLAVAAIPEGLPAIVTITLSIGLLKMARKNAIIRRLPAVETLGSATVICSDKTGTLTENEMTVQKIYADADVTDASEKDLTKGTERTLLIGELCNDADLESGVGDPTELALRVSAQKHGVSGSGYERVDENPFTSERKMMSVVCSPPGGGAGATYVKGAPEVVLKRCKHVYKNGRVSTLTKSDRRAIEKANHAFTDRALRVLAFAYRSGRGETGLTFAGLQGMIDPPRPEARESVRKCEEAGIRVIMITGDHQNTAAAVARELGIPGSSLTGEEIDGMSNGDFERAVGEVNIYARVSPEHKVRITEALRKKGHIVAMTGDGVNDAPALKKSDIGICVGSGTDVTKEAADMVLADDNFASIVDAVEEGRGIYDNIRKFVYYLLSANAGEILTVFTSMVIGLPLPILPLQILWMNLLTDGLPALALGVEKPDPDVMNRKPRDPDEEILSRKSLPMIIMVAVLMAAGALGLFVANLPNEAHARSVAFTTLVVIQLAVAVSFRSRLSLRRIGAFTNRQLIAAIAASLALQIAILYVEPLAAVFGTVPLSLVDWAQIIGVAAAVFAVLEAKKAVLSRLGQHV